MFAEKTTIRKIFFINLAFVSFLFLPLHSQWVTDPELNTPVVNVEGDQTCPGMVRDRFGGAVIVWTDYRNGGEGDIYAQRIDNMGYPVWSDGGVAVCTASGFQRYPVIISNGYQGFIIAWEDGRNDSTDADIFSQRLDLDGMPSGLPMEFPFVIKWIIKMR